mgnify:CR=1 FL=1
MSFTTSKLVIFMAVKEKVSISHIICVNEAIIKYNNCLYISRYTTNTMSGVLGVQEDLWLPSACYMCFGGKCGIRAHRVNGVLTKIEGDKTNPMNEGKLCGKGNAALMSLYNPNRVTKPLRRRNPEKGIGIDPKWEEISWEEATTSITEKLGALKQSDPRKLVIATFDTQATWFLRLWTSAFGTPNVWFAGAGFYCGNGEHPMMLMTHGTFLSGADLKNCKYSLLIGTGFGHLVQHIPVRECIEMAEARAHGMKLVVVDPVCTNAASKADEWIPIRPGTDAAFALGVANLLVNEHNLYDEGFLRNYTNAAYLIRPDGQYARDGTGGKPLVWDSKRKKPLPFDSPEVQDPALSGAYPVKDVLCNPSFNLLKDHLLKYPADRCSTITSVPAKTLRQVAEDMGQAASIGSEISIGGKTLPLRPVIVDYYRGPSQHKHGWWQGFSVHLLNILLGAIDVPGGHQGLDVMGPYWSPKVGPDGFLMAGGEARGSLPFPPRRVKRPENAELLELFPVATYSRSMLLLNLLEPRFGLPYKPEVLINARTNFLLNSANPVQAAEAVRKIDFTLSFAFEMNETSELADIVLPDTHFLERLDPMINGEYIHAPGPGPWYWTYRLPVVDPPSGVKHWLAHLLEWADGLDFVEDVYVMLNAKYGLEGKYRLEPSKRYGYEEIVDMISKAKFGKGLDWFKSHGHVEQGEKTIEEAYTRPFHKGRMPVYLEHLSDVGRDLKKFTKDELDLDWDVSDYHPLPDWKPCPSYDEHDPEYDLYLVNYKLPYHTHTFTAENPWLRHISEESKRDFRVQMNVSTAQRKGLKDGDPVWVESKEGVKKKAVLRTTEAVHDEVLAAPGIFGHWATKMPQSKDKGFNVNAFIPIRLDRIDPLSSALDACVKVRVERAD